MASTLSGAGKRSRGPIHIYAAGSSLSTMCGRGDRAVTIEARRWAECKVCKRLADRMLATPGRR
jgi:hypothetical protein